VKKVTTVFLLLFTSIVVAQHKSVAINEAINTDTEVKVTSMSFNVDSIKELENINWDELKTLFENNKDEEIIKMSFGVDIKKHENKKVSISTKLSVEGKSKDIDNLIEKSKKGIIGLIKFYKKYENK
jgi:hypothetical protein